MRSDDERAEQAEQALLPWDALADRLSAARVVLLDGFSGAGKTTVADALAAASSRAGQERRLVRLEEHVHGWHALADAVDALRVDLLLPLAAGRPGRLRRWDWVRGQPARETRVASGERLLVEGSGAAAAGTGPAREGAVVVWVQADPEARRTRLDARADADAYRPWRDVWARQEHALAEAHGAGREADLVVALPPDGGPGVDLAVGPDGGGTSGGRKSC